MRAEQFRTKSLDKPDSTLGYIDKFFCRTSHTFGRNDKRKMVHFTTKFLNMLEFRVCIHLKWMPDMYATFL